MKSIQVNGGFSLHGSIRVQGAKNLILPCMAATLLTDQPVTFFNWPALTDVKTMAEILTLLGSSVSLGRELRIDTSTVNHTSVCNTRAPQLRASFLLLGPLLHRSRQIAIPLPGGDRIGVRPVDLHLQGLRAFGARIRVENGYIIAEAPDRLTPATIHLRFPSVGATEHLMITAARINGTTVIYNAAREPEIAGLARLLSQMGATVIGAGTSRLIVHGREKLKGTQFSTFGDRIHAATLLFMTAATRGDIELHGIKAVNLTSVLFVLRRMGVEIKVDEGVIYADARRLLRGVSITAGPYPNFPTDAQPLLLGTCATIGDYSEVVDLIFPDRFQVAHSLIKAGVEIQKERYGQITIKGATPCHPFSHQIPDIRAGAALLCTALAAPGRSYLVDPGHLDRGYEDLPGNLVSLGGQIQIFDDRRPGERQIGADFV